MYDHTRAATDAIIRAVRADVAGAADWQQATVAIINSDGTCDVLAADGSTIPHVRRGAGYSSPTVGDVVIMHRASTGDRYLTAVAPADASDTWQTLPLASGYVTRFTICQVVGIGKRIELRGNFQLTGGTALVSTNTSTTFATLPGPWPKATQYAPVTGANAATARLTAQPTGELQYTLTQPPPATVPTWLDLSHARFSLD